MSGHIFFPRSLLPPIPVFSLQYPWLNLSLISIHNIHSLTLSIYYHYRITHCPVFIMDMCGFYFYSSQYRKRLSLFRCGKAFFFFFHFSSLFMYQLNERVSFFFSIEWISFHVYSLKLRLWNSSFCCVICHVPKSWSRSSCKFCPRSVQRPPGFHEK